MAISKYIPFLSPIGIDLRQVLEPTHNWVIEHNSKDLGFPPIAHLLFSPLLIMKHSYAYLVMVIITIMSYFFMSLIFPLSFSKRKDDSLVVLKLNRVSFQW